MLASLLIVFREVLEAGLIVGIVLAATVGVRRRGYWIAGGVLSGVAAAAIVAGFAGVIANAIEGMGQEVFTAGILLLAVAMLGWHSIWMASHGRQLAAQAKALGAAVSSGDKSLFALAVVVFVAVLREGSEVVLFLYSVAVSTHERPLAMLLGGLGGIAAGGAVSFMLYRGLLAIPVRHLFTVTHWMIALLAAGMAAQAAGLLASDDLLPTLGNTVWDTSHLLPADSLFGRPLHILVGYDDRPSGIQLAAWIATLLVLFAAERAFRQRRPVARGSGISSSAVSPQV